MQRQLLRAISAIVSVAVLGYSIFIIRQLWFGLAAFAAITTVYAVWLKGQIEHALVLSALWSVVLAAFWTARLELILVATLVAVVAYLTYDTVWGKGRLPM
jgi:hypothetical protein